MTRVKDFDFPKEEREFSLVDKGTYKCYVYEVEEDVSAQGNPVLNFQYKIAEGPFKGQLLFDGYSLLPQSMWKLQQMLTTFGIEARGKTTVDLDRLVGAKCNVTVTHQNYEGEARARVRKVVGMETIEQVSKKAKVEKKQKKEKEKGKVALKNNEMPEW